VKDALEALEDSRASSAICRAKLGHLTVSILHNSLIPDDGGTRLTDCHGSGFPSHTSPLQLRPYFATERDVVGPEPFADVSAALRGKGALSCNTGRRGNSDRPRTKHRTRGFLAGAR